MTDVATDIPKLTVERTMVAIGGTRSELCVYEPAWTRRRIPLKSQSDNQKI